MSTRAWLAVMLSFALGWMMHDISEYLQEIMLYLAYGGPAC